MVDIEGNIIEETFTDSNGEFEFTVYTDEEYILIGEKENYFSTRGDFSTIGKELDKSKLKEFITNVEFEKNLILDRIIVNKSIVLDNIYYDLDKADIRVLFPQANPILHPGILKVLLMEVNSTAIFLAFLISKIDGGGGISK